MNKLRRRLQRQRRLAAAHTRWEQDGTAKRLMHGTKELGFVYLSRTRNRYDAHRVGWHGLQVKPNLTLTEAAAWLAAPGRFELVQHNSSPKWLRRFKHSLSNL